MNTIAQMIDTIHRIQSIPLVAATPMSPASQ
jgi:hypothetical protein